MSSHCSPPLRESAVPYAPPCVLASNSQPTPLAPMTKRAAGSCLPLRPACCFTGRPASRAFRQPSSIGGVELFRAGQWTALLREAAAAPVPPGPRARDGTSDDARARRATALVHLGELSSAARALTAEPLAPGNTDSLAELRDPARRPPVPYAPLADATLHCRPHQPCPFPEVSFLDGLRSARRGSAAGPSGATNEHLRILLDDEEDARLLYGAASRLANATVPPVVLEGLRVGRLVALRKPNGRVRALVVGDVLRRLVGRVLAQHFAPHLQAACMPYQYGLSTRVGTEAVSRLLRAATEASPRATVLSADAVGAFDHVSRGSMLDALHGHPELQPLLPFARQFYASPSSYTWIDDDGHAHQVTQGEGGEQGDPLMPALYALAQHEALNDLQNQLRDGEAVFAFLDDVYVVALPERIRELYDLLAAALWNRARVRLHEGKTRIWNAAGEEPPNISDFAAGSSEPVWVGNWCLPPDGQGLTVLGSPLGHEDFVARQLQRKRADQDRLLERIPTLDDLQAAWLLLQSCAAPRANYLLRILPPHLTADYAAAHDASVARCLAALLEQGETPLPPTGVRAAHLAQRFGGLGLRSAVADRHAAHWASWQDTLPVIRARAPAAAERLLQALQGEAALPSTAAAVAAQGRLRQAGYDAPGWDAQGAGPPAPDVQRPGEDSGPWPFKGWQRLAARACDERAFETHLSELSPASRALLLSQAGPFAARAINVPPTHPDVTIPSAQFRVLLLRRLRMPLPLAPRRCACHGQLDDPLGDHRAACATSGVLSTRALPLEHAVARVCREAGARVARNVRLADMNLDVPVADARRIEVVANGLPLWHGSQLAVDATIVSPLTRQGQAHPRADVQPGSAVDAAARRKRNNTYPELGHARRCRLVVVGTEVGGRFSTEVVQFLRLLARHRAAAVPRLLRPAAITAWVARWSGLLAVAAQRAFAASLLELPPAADLGDGPGPELHELLAEAR